MGTMDPNLRIAFLKGMIPAEVLRQLDDTELRDRLTRAHELLVKSETADSPALRKAFGTMAGDVLAAQPRAKTEAEVTQWMRKAAAAPTADEAAHARTEAQRIQQANPVAPRRADRAPANRHLGPGTVWTEVYDKSGRRLGTTPAAAIRKADKPPMLVAFDADGRIIGIVDPKSVQPVGNASTKTAPAKTQAAQKPAAAPAANTADVTKHVGRRAR